MSEGTVSRARKLTESLKGVFEQSANVKRAKIVKLKEPEFARAFGLDLDHEFRIGPGGNETSIKNPGTSKALSLAAAKKLFDFEVLGAVGEGKEGEDGEPGEGDDGTGSTGDEDEGDEDEKEKKSKSKKKFKGFGKNKPNGDKNSPYEKPNGDKD